MPHFVICSATASPGNIVAHGAVVFGDQLSALVRMLSTLSAGIREKTKRMSALRFVLIALASCLSAGASFAQHHSNERNGAMIQILAPLAMTGSLSATSAEYLAGAEAHLRFVNSANGIRGRRLELVVADNSRVDEAHSALSLLFSRHPGAIAVFMPMQTVSALELINGQNIPIIAPPNGSFEEHDSNFAPNSFHFKGGWGVEYAKIAEHLSALNIDRVAFLYDSVIGARESNSFALITQIFLKRRINIKPIYLKDGADNLTSVMAELGASAPQAVVLGLLGNDIMKFLDAYGKHREKWPLYSTSHANQLSIREAAKAARATVGITQELPPFWDWTVPIVREYQEAMKKTGKTDFGYHSLEGYIAARILTEALRRTSPTVSRESLFVALESMSKLDLGGFIVSFGQGKHTSASYIDLTLLRSDGRYMR